MATVKQVLSRTTGAGSAATQYKKSARVSARTFSSPSNQRTLRNIQRRKSLGGKGG